MTFEKKCLVEFSDIAALHLECPRCQTVMAFKSGDWLRLLPETLAKGCPYCNAPFAVKRDTPDYETICELVGSLTKIADTLKERDFLLKMEITCPE